MAKVRKPLTQQQKLVRNAYMKKWRHANKKSTLAYQIQYRKSHKAEVDVYHYKYRRTLRGAYNYNKYYAKRRGRIPL